jgi:hypothetical protein
VSLLLTSFARQGVRAGAAPPPFVSLPAVYREWESPTDDTARFSLPLPPNHGYTTADVRVFVSGVEQAIYIEELRGRHNDGTGGDGGARAFFVECDASAFTDADPAEIQLGNGTRGTTDLSASGRGSMAMLKAHYDNPRVILPTSAEYLCSTWATFHPLVPDAQKHPDDQTYAVTFRNTHIANYGVAWWAAPAGYSAYGGATNWYDMGWTAFAWWCETGDPQRWWEANRWTVYWFLTSSPPANDTTTAAGIHLNPENLNGQCASNLAEWRSMYIRESATAYLCIGYGQFWRNVNTRAMVGSMGTQGWYDSGVNIIGTGGGRFNMAIRCLPGMYGALIDATWIMPTGDWAGGNIRRQPTFTTDLPRIITAFNDAVLTTAGAGAYKAGYKGYRDGTDAMGELSNQPGSLGDFEQFQGSIPTQTLIDYYLNVHADSQILAMIRKNIEVLLNNMKEVTPGSGKYGAPYMATRYPGERRGAIEPPFDGGPYYRYVNTTTTAIDANTATLPASVTRTTAQMLNKKISFWWQSGGNQNPVRTITAYNDTTRVATFDTPLSPVPPTAAISCSVFTEVQADAIEQDGAIGNAADHMRILQFLVALYPTDVVNGKTITEWCNIMASTIAAMGADNIWATSGSTLGRWMVTQGCYFRVNGIPAGPSAIREPVIYGSA